MREAASANRPRLQVSQVLNNFVTNRHLSFDKLAQQANVEYIVFVHDLRGKTATTVLFETKEKTDFTFALLPSSLPSLLTCVFQLDETYMMTKRCRQYLVLDKQA